MSNILNSILNYKIDFSILVLVRQANPNGDPLNGNRPRITTAGYGEISAECIKRKIRNRLQDMGLLIFLQSADRSDDGCASLNERACQNITDYSSADEYAAKACEKWLDVRGFGQLFAFKSKDKKEGVSVGVRGPVTIRVARSISPVEICSLQITKSVNSETSDKKGSETMGMKHYVEFGLYRIDGSINVQLAEKTGFTREDAEHLKEALRTLFVNDASAARPEGSMEVLSLYWWEHNCKIGQYSAARVQDTLKIRLKDGVLVPESVDDYEITLENLPGLEPEIIQGV